MARTLRQAVEQIRSAIPISSGPRGTGKTSVACQIFAKAKNCPNQVNGEPCNDCYICESITNGSLEDVIEIDAASTMGSMKFGIFATSQPMLQSLAKHKVYIIDEVHILSTGAFNALLRRLEEPTEMWSLSLQQQSYYKIPATILSRVQRFEFKSIKLPDIVHHLKDILATGGGAYETDAVESSLGAEGGMRDALSIWTNPGDPDCG